MMKRINYNYKRQTKSVALLLFVLFFLYPIYVYASNATSMVNVTKTAPLNVTINQSFNISILIKSSYDTDVNATIFEPQLAGAIPVGNLTPVQLVPNDGEFKIYVAPLYYEWNRTLISHSTTNITYAARALSSGALVIGSTSVTVRNQTYYSNSLFITVACNDNGICQPNLGENAVTCPYDCKTSEPPSNNTTPVITQIPTPIKNQTNTTVVNVIAPKNNNLLIVLSVVFAIIIIILVVAIILTSSKHTDNEWMNKSTKK